MLYEDEGVGEDVICSAVEPSCPECPPGEDSVSSMPACMSKDELLGDVLPATPVVPNVLYTICEQDGNLQDEPSGDVLDGP